MRITICFIGLILKSTCLIAQQTDSALEKISQFPDRLFSKIRNKTARIDDQVTRQTEKYLARLSKKEEKLRNKLYQKDSVAANNIFAGEQAKYASLKASLESASGQGAPNPLHEYIPGVDSMQSALKFISNSDSKISGFPLQKLQSVQAADTQLLQLEARLQSANDIDQFIKQREQQLRNQLSQFGMGKELAGLNNEAFYYQQQLVEYKNMLHDPDKLENKVLGALRDVPAFKDFISKNSYLGQLFGLPDNYGSITSLAGLQTRSQVQQLVSNSIGSMGNGGGTNPDQFVTQQIQRSQQAISQLKNKLSFLGNPGGSGDLTMLSGSSVNNQKTKTFLKRIEYGFNVQTQPSTYFLPANANMALILGYKLTGNISFGIGGSYFMGMGTGLNHIHFSNQGIGIRSYFDIRMKASIFLSGGFEYNYLQAFNSLQSIAHFDIWQKSALIGLSKQTKVTKNKTSNMQLLFDALYKQHVPASSPVVFRMGFKL